MKYKLVPVEPTREMIHAGQMAVSGFPRDVLERWEAMLAAAPEVEQEPLAWIINHADWGCSEPTFHGNIAERYEADQPGCTVPLYAHPQPAPEVAKLVEALEGLLAIIDDSLGVSGYHLNGAMAKWCEFEEVEMAEEALALYRKKGGEL